VFVHKFVVVLNVVAIPMNNGNDIWYIESAILMRRNVDFLDADVAKTFLAFITSSATAFGLVDIVNVLFQSNFNLIHWDLSVLLQ
jgi:hypothetical protein